MKNSVFYSPAKINLFLKVLSQRLDGYHELLTIMHPLSLCDIIECSIKKTRGISVEMEYEKEIEDIPLQQNLLYKAAALFCQKQNIKDGIRIFCKKRIPLAAGLGGGSSNAAAVLRGLNTLFQCHAACQEMDEMARSLGADVAFFLYNATCLLGGRGDVLIECLPTRVFDFLLIKSHIMKSYTQSIYRRMNLNLTKDNYLNTINSFKLVLQNGDRSSLGRLLVNDLEQVIIQDHPLLEEIKSFMQKEYGLDSLITGSGPTIFVLLNRQDEGGGIAQRVQERFGSEYVCYACSSFLAGG